MFLKILLIAGLLVGAKFIHASLTRKTASNEAPIDEFWWNGLTEEWKTIFLINQTLQQNGVDIYKIQNDYLNRLNKGDDPGLSEINTALYDLEAAKEFGLSYSDFYARVSRTMKLVKSDTIDLNKLAQLETLYIVNSPSDLSPLRKFTQLKTLILNFGGRPYGSSLSEHSLDLEPIRNLTSLRALHCVSCPIKSLDPVSNLINLEELCISNTSVASLASLHKLVHLKRLSFGSSVKSISPLKHLILLEELYVRGCKDLSGLSGMKGLKKLSIAENELAVVNDAYRIKDLSFLKDLKLLQFLDVENTSYIGSLSMVSNLSDLRAVTLPRVSSMDAAEFKKSRPGCVIINAYEFER